MRSLGFGFGLETFANFWRVGIGFGEFGLGKKSWYATRYRLYELLNKMLEFMGDWIEWNGLL